MGISLNNLALGGANGRLSDRTHIASRGARGVVTVLMMVARGLSVASALLALTVPARAQSAPGVLLGRVTGPAGEGLSGVSLQLTGEASRSLVYNATTDAAGKFQFVGISPGSYTLEATAPDGHSVTRLHLEVRSSVALELNLTASFAAATPLRATPQTRAIDREVSWGTQFSALSISKLPSARNVWSVLESQEPSTVTDRLDVGGLRTGEAALFGALGASWTENQYELNGFNVTDPYQPGRPLADPDLDALIELQTVSGAKPATFASAGINLTFSTSAATEDLHGAARGFFSGRSLQSDNLDARLRRFHFPGPERFKHSADGTIQLGGKLPLPTAAWPFFVSLSTQQLSKGLGGFAGPIDVRVYRALAEFTPLSRGPQRVDLLYSGQHIFNSREGAEPRLAPSATTRANQNFHQFQARWQRRLDSTTWLAAGFGVAHAIVSSEIQPGLEGASTIDLPLLTRTGPASLSRAGLRTRYEGNALVQTVRANHVLSLGADAQRSSISNRWDSLSGLEQVLVNGVGTEVTRWNTPARAYAHVQNIAAFAQDAWRPLRWLRLPLGLRLDSSSGQAAGTPTGIRWTTLQPRAGLVVPVARAGPVLRASWSRYAHLFQGRYLDFGNPAALGGQVFSWQDLNGDQAVQAGEISTLLRVFGGPYSALDRNLARPFTDEVSVGLDQDFSPGIRASVRFFRRDSHRLIGLSNVGVPMRDYTPLSFPDPGNDGIPGNADDQVLTLYNRNSTALGQDFHLLTNPPGQHASFKGFEIRLVKPLLHLWAFSASFTAMRTLAPTSPGNSVLENDTGIVGLLGADPNTLVFASSRTYFDRAFVGKAAGYYFAPGKVQLATVVKYYDGLPFGRLLFVEGFNQGPFFVRATPRAHPGGFQTQFNLTVDVRVAREFAVRRGTLSGYLDVFNIQNLNKNTLEGDLTGPMFEARVPLAIQAPRAARLGIEWRF